MNFLNLFSEYPKTKKNKNMLIKGEFRPPKPIFKRGNSPTQIIKKGEFPQQNHERGHSPRKRWMWQHCFKTIPSPTKADGLFPYMVSIPLQDRWFCLFVIGLLYFLWDVNLMMVSNRMTSFLWLYFLLYSNNYF